jgi:hypothetical protein
MQPDDVIMAATYQRVRELKGADPWSNKSNQMTAKA